MKRTAAYFFLALFLFNTMGYYLAFVAMQSRIRSQVREEIMKEIFRLFKPLFI